MIVDEIVKEKIMKFTDKKYDILKWVAMVVLPAFTILFKVLGSIWAIPFTDQISDSLVAINAFLGAVLGVSVANYNKEK